MNTQFNSNVIWLQLEYKISTLKYIRNANVTLLYKSNTLNLVNWNMGFVKLVVPWAERDTCGIEYIETYSGLTHF